VSTRHQGHAPVSRGNVNGHILRLKEGNAGSAAPAFTWDIYLFGAEAGADAGHQPVRPERRPGLLQPRRPGVQPSTGICWIQTDDGAYTDVTNCMMLAGLPGQVGDGGKRTLSYTRVPAAALTVDTFIGKAPTADTLKRFLVGPVGCEITGLCETPGRQGAVRQHPASGREHRQANVGDPAKYTSQWPANAGYGAGKRPRSATIVITKNDGGRIGT
jgi:secreted PhoX family phosphatase